MSRVEINADGRQVVVDHVGDLPYLIEQAMGAWTATAKEQRSTGFAPDTHHHVVGCAVAHARGEACTP